jgi:hypothetical protein
MSLYWDHYCHMMARRGGSRLFPFGSNRVCKFFPIVLFHLDGGGIVCYTFHVYTAWMVQESKYSIGTRSKIAFCCLSDRDIPNL